MFKSYLTIIATAIALSSAAQTISDLENFNLNSGQYWNGSTNPGGTTFTSGNATYVNEYDTSFGGYWASGWAYSTMKDDSTSGFTNQYSAITASGTDNSETYAVGQQDAVIQLTSEAKGGAVSGLYVTNSTYAYLSMRDGDFFGKAFGDSLNAVGQPDGTNGEDFFKLTIGGWFEGQIVNDSVEFYLADFRYSDDNLDYILDDWEWVSLSKLGNVDSLKFSLRSSDNGVFGMNTPAFFCIDNLTTKDEPAIDTTLAIVDGDSLYIVGNDTFEIFDGAFVPLTIEDFRLKAFEVFPNPAGDYLTLSSNHLNFSSVHVLNLQGEILITSHIHIQKKASIDVSSLASGSYFIQIKFAKEQAPVITKTFVKL